MDSAAAPDPLTFQVHWSKIDPRSPQGLGLSPLPKHLLEDLYLAGDKDAFSNSSRFTDDFVGLGPYRLARWERGSHMELTRFDGYFQGRPPLDGISIRFIPDPNAMVANALSGTVDVILPPSLDLDAALALRQQWAGTANTVSIGALSAFLYLEIQYRPELARPTGGFTERLVRQAFFHATDRQTLTDVMTDGTSPIADSWLRPGTQLRRDVEPAIPQYPFDPRRAQQLLTQAGWERNAEGALISARTGERFASDLWANTKVIVAGDRQASIIAQDWKATGADFSIHQIPAPLANDREYGSKYPTASITRIPVDNFLDRLDSRFIAAPANDWGGRNKMGYVNPAVDVLLDRFALAVEPRDQAAVTRDLVRESLDDAAFIPLYWESHPVVMLAGVRAAIEANNAGWNAHEWDKL
jgi:peptide/nickel transport system substrate-binding protein